jgi:hypothetical protein
MVVQPRLRKRENTFLPAYGCVGTMTGEQKQGIKIELFEGIKIAIYLDVRVSVKADVYERPLLEDRTNPKQVVQHYRGDRKQSSGTSVSIKWVYKTNKPRGGTRFLLSMLLQLVDLPC